MNNMSIAPLAERPDWYRVEDDTVVTCDKAGNDVSLFGDDAWDVRAYAVGLRWTHIYFRGHLPDGVSRVLSDATTRQWKQVMYFLMHEATDTVPASSTLQTRSVYLREFTFFAAARQLTLYEGLSNGAVVLDYVAQAGMETKAQRLHSILVKLHRLGVETTGLRVPQAQLHKPLLERFAQQLDTHNTLSSRRGSTSTSCQPVSMTSASLRASPTFCWTTSHDCTPARVRASLRNW
jgi:hypothetical protein